MSVFEVTVLRTLPGSQKEGVTGDCRILHNEGLHIFYSSPNIIRMIKSRRIRCAGHVARTGKLQSVPDIDLENVSVDGRIILKRFLGI
jgi:hypothetical protein